jgi:hypothetical protein
MPQLASTVTFTPFLALQLLRAHLYEPHPEAGPFPSLGSGDFAKAEDKKGFLGKIYFLT